MKIFCDGACEPNPGHMGAGVFLADRSEGFSWPLGRGTNQRAELHALIRALELASDGDEIFSDSRYALGLAQGWRARVNRDLAAELRRAMSEKRVFLRWVKGHNGNEYQEMADRLAGEAVVAGVDLLADVGHMELDSECALAVARDERDRAEGQAQ